MNIQMQHAGGMLLAAGWTAETPSSASIPGCGCKQIPPSPPHRPTDRCFFFCDLLNKPKVYDMINLINLNLNSKIFRDVIAYS